MALPKQNRLPRVEFVSVKKGISFGNADFSCVYRKNSLGDLNRFSVVVSLRVSKRAVVRHRLSRLIYTSLMPPLPFVGIDLIIYPKKSMLNLNHDQICSLLNSSLSKIHS